MSSFLLLILVSCSNKKNTAFSRAYHSVNTKYNIHFNANEAYKMALENKEKSEGEQDNMSKMLNIYPLILDSADLRYKGNFTTTIDKTTKAIKLHSITTRPRRDPGKKMSEEYRQWLRQKEFNPFLVNTWMLLAKAEFQEGSYLRAITTFMHITKIYQNDKKVVSESKLWIARAYSEMGWMYEAENVLRKMEQNDEIHPDLLGMYGEIKANIYIRNKNYTNAIPYLEGAIKDEKNKNIKRRNRYILGQVYAELGEDEKAYKTFGSVRGMTAPYKYTINSKLRQIEVSPMPQKQKISSLYKLAKSSANEDYIDQIYTVAGDVYLNDLDTINAIENYAKAIDKSTKLGYDKALAQIKLGGLYFQQREFIKAQPHYSGALPLLKKMDEYYPEVSFRSEVLDQLIVHAKVVHEQDSLLTLANMPEDERLMVINEHIEKLKKEEEERKRAEEVQLIEDTREVTGWGDLAGWGDQPQVTAPVIQQPAGSDFYFYNETTVAQGKVSFQKQWGKRPLADNWRRADKTSSSPFGEEDELLAEEESDREESGTEGDGEKKETAETDIYSVEFYLQQLPLTEEAKQASYKLIDDGLYNMGLIYKDLLEDNSLAINTFQENLSRFPLSENREEIYFQLFLIYLRMGDNALAADYRNRLIEQFSKSKYALPLSDDNYAWNFTYMGKLQEDMYQQAYDAYYAGDVTTVRRNYEEIQTKFPFVSLMPKFAFLNALTYAQTKDAKSLEENLTKLVAEYPQSEVVPLANKILNNIKDGMILLSDGTPITSMDWTMAYANDSIFEGENAKVIEYLTDLGKPYTLLLMFKPNTIDRNDLLFEVADYNFSNYVIQTYDLNFTTDAQRSVLEIKGFENFKAIKSYLNKAMDEEGLLTKLDKRILPVPISSDNYKTIYPRLGVEEYMTFYTDSLATETPQLLAYWAGDNDLLLAKVEEEQKEEPDISTPKEKEEQQPLVPETGEKKVIFDKEPLAEVGKKEEEYNDKEINLEDILSKDQVAAIGKIDKKTDDIVEAINQLGTNPVEGLKNIFNRNKIEDNLTKEEKEELKKQQKEEKERQKQLARIEKAKQDSIARIEKQVQDSIKRAEQIVADSIQNVKKAEEDRIKQEKEERIRQVKEKEEERKRQTKEREDARKQSLKDREDRRKAQEKERNEKLRQREEERKIKEREAEELRKKREKERKELQKQREQELKQKGR